jgi:hypothetical protein
MSDCRTMIMPDDSHAAVLDAAQRAVVDKCASKATHKTAFSALLTLVGAGVLASRRDVGQFDSTAMSDPGLDACQNAGSRADFVRRYCSGSPLGADRSSPRSGENQSRDGQGQFIYQVWRY